MGLDSHGSWWAIRCLFVGVLITLGFYSVPLIYPQLERLCYTSVGLMGASGAVFCSSLSWVKMLPMFIRKKFQSALDHGHAWIGLLSCWCVLLHTRFTINEYWSVHKLLLVMYYIMIGFGVVAYWFHGMQILQKDAKGSTKREHAGWLLSYAYETSKFIHEVIHYFFYALLLLHVYAFFYYGRFW